MVWYSINTRILHSGSKAPSAGGFRNHGLSDPYLCIPCAINHVQSIVYRHTVYHKLYTMISLCVWDLLRPLWVAVLVPQGVGGQIWASDGPADSARKATSATEGAHALTHELHASKSPWKWRGALYRTTILYIGLYMSFHVDLGEGKVAQDGLVKCNYVILPE